MLEAQLVPLILEHPPPPGLCEVLGAAGTHQHPRGDAPPSSHRPSSALPGHRFLSQRPVTNWD